MFICPRSIAIDEYSKFYVVDMYRLVQVFDSQGTCLYTFEKSLASRPFKPVDIVMDRHHQFLVTEYEPPHVCIFNASGKFLGVFGQGVLSLPNGIAIDRSQNILVADVSKRCVEIFDRNKVHVGSFGKFTQPTSITVNSKGFIFVADYNSTNFVQVFDSSYKHVRNVKVEGCQGCYGLCVDAQDRLLVTDEKTQKLFLMNEDGKILCTVGSQPGAFNMNPLGVAVTPDGKVALADSDNHRILLFEYS